MILFADWLYLKLPTQLIEHIRYKVPEISHERVSGTGLNNIDETFLMQRYKYRKIISIQLNISSFKPLFIENYGEIFLSDESGNEYEWKKIQNKKSDIVLQIEMNPKTVKFGENNSYIQLKFQYQQECVCYLDVEFQETHGFNDFYKE